MYENFINLYPPLSIFHKKKPNRKAIGLFYRKLMFIYQF